MSQDLLSEEIFCHALFLDQLEGYCHFCLRRETRGGTSQLKRCVSCRLVHYCGTECQQADWKMHKMECQVMKNLVPSSLPACDDSVRLVLRLAQKWARGEMGEMEVDGGERSLATLEEHGKDEELEKEATQFVKDFNNIVQKRIVPDDILQKIYKKSSLNSFGVSNEFGSSIGVGLCIKLSYLNHSCQPSTRMTYNSRQVTMVPTNPKNVPKRYSDAQHSYIDELLPLQERRSILLKKYKFHCGCVGCLNSERNGRMEAWLCENCQDGWVPPGEATCCHSCHVSPSTDHVHTCLMVVETLKAGNKTLARSDLPADVKLKLADQLWNMMDDSFHKLNVMRIPSLMIKYRAALNNSEQLEEAAKWGDHLLSIHQSYRHPLDVAVCQLKYGLAQVYKKLKKDKLVAQLLSPEVVAVFGKAFGPQSEIYCNCQIMLKC